jgi:hypothetical protein
MSTKDWEKYINENGDFEFPKYLHKTITDLMKTTLDLGTLVCADSAKLRAYKERVKSAFKDKWVDIATALESFDIIEPCVCKEDEFCTICGGSRYLLNDALTSDEIRQLSVVFAADNHADLSKKLEQGLLKALNETQNHFNRGGGQNG